MGFFIVIFLFFLIYLVLLYFSVFTKRPDKCIKRHLLLPKGQKMPQRKKSKRSARCESYPNIILGLCICLPDV